MNNAESKALQTLRGHINWLKTDLQVTDVLCRRAIKQMKKQPSKDRIIADAFRVSSVKYDSLNHPVSKATQIFNQTINRRIEYAICQTYGYFSEYMHSLLLEIYKHNPKKVLNTLLSSIEKADSIKTLSVNEIVTLGSYEQIEKKIIDDIFRKLEDEQSTQKLLQKILKSCELQGEIDGNKIKETLKYLELRHLIIHHKSNVDAKYAREYGKTFRPCLNAGDKFPRTYATCKETYTKTFALCKEIDKKLIDKGFVSPRA